MNKDINLLKIKANDLRKDVLELIHTAKTGHTGSDLSCTDILVALYYDVMNVDASNPNDPNRDRYIQSKGHAAEMLWVILGDKGFFDKNELFETYSKYNSRFIGHPNNSVDGVEMNTGSLGHGLSISVGSALAAKKKNEDYHTYTLLGDGELAEGSVWEGAMAAAQFKLDNLTAIIDHNGLQITGTTEDVMNTGPLADKWESFGWNVYTVDGHNIEELIETLRFKPEKDKPTLIIAETVKGKGVSFMENQAGWHHRVPTEDEMKVAFEELSQEVGVTQ